LSLAVAVAVAVAGGSQEISETLVKFLTLASHRLIGGGDAPLGQKQFDVAQAEHMVRPGCAADDSGGEAVAVVRVGSRLHVASLSPPPGRLTEPVIVTMPGRLFAPRHAQIQPLCRQGSPASHIHASADRVGRGRLWWQRLRPAEPSA
jgi:hypothetical protein